MTFVIDFFPLFMANGKIRAELKFSFNNWERNCSVEITLTPDCITLLLNFVFVFLFSLKNFIAIYFRYHNFHSFKVVFSVVTEVCNHHYNFKTFSKVPKGVGCPNPRLPLGNC